ncbi:MAG: PAS domain S-box protein [Flavipsychrobacter sp.]|nr:PAS domain S-box protein [Flavipsychrobacter sp.]
MDRNEQRILILEDNINDFGLLYQQLRALTYHGDDIYKFSTLNNLLSVPEGDNRILLLNFSLLGADPKNSLQQVAAAFPGIPVVVLCEMSDSEEAAELMKEGAQDCLVKGQFTEDTLAHSITMARVRKQATGLQTINEAIEALPQHSGPVVPAAKPQAAATEAPALHPIVPRIEHVTITTQNNYQLFEESPIPMWIYHSGTGKILMVNAAAIYHYGYSEEEFLEMGVQDLRVAGDKPIDAEVVKIPLLNSFYNSSKRRHVKKDGEAFYVQVYTHTILYETGTAGLMMALDINNRYVVEKQNAELHEIIRQQNRQFDDILTSVSEVIWSCNADDSRILYINNACAAVYGYSPEELKENSGILASLVHPEDIDIVEQAYLGLAQTGKLHVEHRVYDKDGKLKHIVTQAVLKKENEDSRGIVNGITIDITRLRDIEEKLRESSREMETILESITDGFFAINKNWEFTYVNKEFERILRLNGQVLIGRNIWETVPGVEEMQVYQELYRAVKENHTVRFEEYFPPLKIWLSVNAYPRENGLAVYFRDITEEKKRILRIEEQNKKLTDIAWLQSHKVRGPVATIMGLVRLFNYENPADPENQKILEGIEYATTGLDDIIREVVEKTTGTSDDKK